jgi:hypothetical protein
MPCNAPQVGLIAEAEQGMFAVVQQSISFGDSSDKVAAAAAAAQRAMQEQELAELVSLGFDEADAKVGCCIEFCIKWAQGCEPWAVQIRQAGAACKLTHPAHGDMCQRCCSARVRVPACRHASMLLMSARLQTLLPIIDARHQLDSVPMCFQRRGCTGGAGGERLEPAAGGERAAGAAGAGGGGGGRAGGLPAHALRQAQAHRRAAALAGGRPVEATETLNTSQAVLQIGSVVCTS